jgi:hypothetical protein
MNTLVHYRPHTGVQERLSLDAPLYGLLDASLPADDPRSLGNVPELRTAHVADRMSVSVRGLTPACLLVLVTREAGDVASPGCCFRRAATRRGR